MTAQSLKVNELVDRRNWVRFDLDQHVSLTARAGQVDYDCRLEDISLGGARIRLDGRLPQGAEILLQHRSAGEMKGTCVWQSKGALGVAFSPPARELEHLLQCISLILNTDD